MAIEFKLPDLGENISSADVGRILVMVGDVVEPEQIIMELETEKAVYELPCPHAGKVLAIHVKEGETVHVGQLILTLDGTAAGAKPAKGPSKPAASAPPPAPAVPPAPEPATPAVAAAPAVPTVSASLDGMPPAPAGPATRRLARELGVDLHRVTGSGPGGRITPEDVKEFVREGGVGSAGAGESVATPALPDFATFGAIERQPLNKLAQTAAANLQQAWRTIPHVTQHDLADVTDVEAARRRFVERRPDAPKVTMTVLAVKACVVALKEFPHFNASLDTKSNELILKKHYHIGIAVDTPNGLVAPVVRDADRKTVRQLASEVKELADRARARKLDLASMKGGTFTISNLGGIGGTGFTPIVNWPEVAILGLSRSREQPIIVDGAVKARLMLPISLSYDHRVINGADAARFAARIATLLSDPFELLIDL